MVFNCLLNGLQNRSVFRSTGIILYELPQFAQLNLSLFPVKAGMKNVIWLKTEP